MNHLEPYDFKACLDELLPQALDIRRSLHQHPELAFQEEQTAERIRRQLAAWG